MGTLFIVPTPIGNLEDITLRALRILKEVTLIAAEDTRTTTVLLRHYEILTPLTSYHEHNKLTKLGTILDALETGDVALVSDAGMPGISDPGYELIREAIVQGVTVVPLPGANAVLPALVGSGFATDRFLFVGFVPRKNSARHQFIEALRDETATILAYESPHRLLETLTTIVDVMGASRHVCIAREISKLYEEFQRGVVDAVRAYFEEHPPRGEIVLIIEGTTTDNGMWDEAQVKSALRSEIASGESLNRAAKTIAQASGWRKRDVYTLGTTLLD